jgi:hypothetical protein
MRMIRRHLIFLSFALPALAAFFILAAQPAEAKAAQAQIEAVDLSDFNLGDCLRDTNHEDWPPAYALICADLAVSPASPAKAGPATVRKEPPSPPVAKPEPKVKTKTADAVPLPLSRPMTKTLLAAGPTSLSAPAPAPAKPEPVRAVDALVPPPPACLIDEHGGTTILDAPHRKSPPQVVSQKSRGRAQGIALLVPASCGVKSPMKAKVLYAGDFKGYRGVVILGLPGKSRLIVAGLDALRVKRGQTVEQGAVLGLTLPMGAPALVTAFNADMDKDRSLIFFDLRNAKGASKSVYWLADAS